MNTKDEKDGPVSFRHEQGQKSQSAGTVLTEEAKELLWRSLVRLQGRDFQTARGLRYTYQIKGNEMFVTRKNKSITRATVMMAYRRALLLMEAEGCVSGPKKLGTFGASYLYPIFMEIGILRDNKMENVT